MKVILNPEEVKAAIEQYVKNQYLNGCYGYDVEVLDTMDEDGVSLDLENQVTFECGVLKKEQATPVACPGQVAPVAPARTF